MAENENEGDDDEESYIRISAREINYAWMHEPPDGEPKNDSGEEQS